MTDFSFDNNSSLSRNSTSQRIDDDGRPAHSSTTTPTTGISGSAPTLLPLRPFQAIVAGIVRQRRLRHARTRTAGGSTRRPRCRACKSNCATTATATGTVSKHRSITATRSGENLRFSAAYSIKRSYDRSKMLSVDFLDDPQGTLDPVNSYNYTNDSYSHSLQAGLNYSRDGLWIIGTLTGWSIRSPAANAFGEGTLPEAVLPAESLVQPYGRPIKRRFHPQHQLLFADDPDRVAAPTIDATNPSRCGPETPGLKLPNDMALLARISFNNAPKRRGPPRSGSTAVHLQLHRLAAHPVPRRDLHLPKYDYTARKGCAVLDADQRRRMLQTRRIGRFLPNRSPPAALDGQRHHLLISTDPLFPRRDALPLGPPCALVPRQLPESGFSSKGQNRRLLRDLDELLLHRTAPRRTCAKQSAPAGPALRKVFRLRGEHLRFYCSNSHTLHTPQRDPQRRGGRKFGKENRLGLSMGRHRHPQPSGLCFDGVQRRLHAHLLDLYLGRYGYLRIAYILNETEPKCEQVRISSSIFTYFVTLES